jgi:hypothetical protein
MYPVIQTLTEECTDKERARQIMNLLLLSKRTKVKIVQLGLCKSHKVMLVSLRKKVEFGSS